MNKHILSKAFFGKDNCLRVYLNTKKECFFEFGFPRGGGKNWSWKAVKFSDVELGELIAILEGVKDSTSFFHSYNGGKTQIWVRKNKESFFIRLKDLSKGLNIGEQVVLRELLSHIIIISNSYF